VFAERPWTEPTDGSVRIELLVMTDDEDEAWRAWGQLVAQLLDPGMVLQTQERLPWPDYA